MRMFFFFFKQKTAYEMRISDWSSDVCSSDLMEGFFRLVGLDRPEALASAEVVDAVHQPRSAEIFATIRPSSRSVPTIEFRVTSLARLSSSQPSVPAGGRKSVV